MTVKSTKCRNKLMDTFKEMRVTVLNMMLPFLTLLILQSTSTSTARHFLMSSCHHVMPSTVLQNPPLLLDFLYPIQFVEFIYPNFSSSLRTVPTKYKGSCATLGLPLPFHSIKCRGNYAFLE